MKLVRVNIKNKTGVFDPEAEVVQGALLNLGHDVQGVSIKKVIEFSISEEGDALEIVNEICQQLLVNPVLESYSIEFPTSSGRGSKEENK